MSSLFKEYFTFSKSERNATIILAIILILVIGLNYTLPLFISENKTDFSKFENEVNEFEKRILKLNNEKVFYRKDASNFDPVLDEVTQGQSKLFYFDPNNTSYQEWVSLGVKPKTAKTIQNYLDKGGKFYKKKDLKRIYGLNQNLYLKLKPYININKEYNKQYSSPESFNRYDKYSESLNKEPFKIIELNTATEEDLIKLKGIGSTFSKRIIGYRDLLGGFYNKAQLKEVYGINDTIYAKISNNVQVDNTKIIKLKLNLCNIKTLSNHRYIDYSLAKKIVEDRTKNGPFKSLDDLVQRNLIEDKEEFNKISHYLELW